MEMSKFAMNIIIQAAEYVYYF